MAYDAGKYDIAVVGAGHAGCEAALASARLGFKTLLLTINLDGIALMACNPAIGGTSKGHLVREIDALGGQMGLCADESYMQIKMLNTSKGAAVQSLRSQQDKKLYQQRHEMDAGEHGQPASNERGGLAHTFERRTHCRGRNEPRRVIFG